MLNFYESSFIKLCPCKEELSKNIKYFRLNLWSSKYIKFNNLYKKFIKIASVLFSRLIKYC